MYLFYRRPNVKSNLHLPDSDRGKLLLDIRFWGVRLLSAPHGGPPAHSPPRPPAHPPLRSPAPWVALLRPCDEEAYKYQRNLNPQGRSPNKPWPPTHVCAWSPHFYLHDKWETIFRHLHNEFRESHFCFTTRINLRPCKRNESCVCGVFSVTYRCGHPLRLQHAGRDQAAPGKGLPHCTCS